MIAVAGSINWDIVVRVPHLPQVGETVLGSGASSGLGGKGANQAVAAARASAAGDSITGNRVRLIGSVGSDGFGGSARRVLEAEGLDLEHLHSDETSTGIALIGVDALGQNSIMLAPGANHSLQPEAVDQQAFEATDLLLVQLEIPLEIALIALRNARAIGVRTVLNASPVPSQSTSSLLVDVDVLLVNEVEAGQLLDRPRPATPTQALEYARLLHSHGPAVVLTLGADGAVWCDASGCGHAPGHTITVLDTTGAGDAFAGALAVALGETSSLERAVRFSNAAGALAATREGAAASSPNRSEIESFLRQSEHRCNGPHQVDLKEHT
jgi:ribokinase